jgi:hypothetical protein
MSVLSFPRIYFKGFLEWDPCTFNNNDFQPSPTYDGGRVALNWDFLGGTGPSGGITPENFQETFRPWAISQQDVLSGAVPAEWNMWGTHAVRFVQYGEGKSTQITGGATQPGSIVTDDAMVGGQVLLTGTQGTPAVLVDTNMSSFWSSQIYWGGISIGSGDAAISAPMRHRMHSRWLNLNRIFSTTSQQTQPAAAVSCVWQTAIPFADVVWPEAGVSSLADALKAAASASGAQGIMIRFNSYVNLYFQNGVFNNVPVTPRNYNDLAVAYKDAWDAWWGASGGSAGTDTSLFFSQPCYSHVVGVVGVWNDDELASVPVGRYLAPQNLVGVTGATGPTGPTGPTGVSTTAADLPDVLEGTHAVVLRHAKEAQATAEAGYPSYIGLGPLVAEINTDLGVVSLDLNSTIPEYGYPGEWPSDLTKADLGPLSVGVLLSNNSVTTLGEIGYDSYDVTAYEASAGIVDVPLSMTGAVPEGALVVQSQNTIVLQEQIYSAQTDTRGIYLDQGMTASIGVSIYERGAPSPNAQLLVARYGSPYQLPPLYGNLNLIPVGPTAPADPISPTAFGPTAYGATGPAEQVVNFTNGTISQMYAPPSGPTSEVTTLTANGDGVATLGVSAQTPGFMVLGFFPYAPGATIAPALPSNLNPFSVQAPLSPTGPYAQNIDNWFYTTVRVLPFDDDLPQTFCDLWNTTHDENQAWEFIYSPTSPSGGILYLYDMIFSVMLEYVNLGERAAVEHEIVPIWIMIAADSAAEGSNVMPITRDMSAGKRLVLQLWIYLVANGYPTDITLTPQSIDGWSPIT